MDNLTAESAGLTAPPFPTKRDELLLKLASYDAPSAAELLATQNDDEAVFLLQKLNPEVARDLLPHLPADTRQRLLDAAPGTARSQWASHESYPENSIGRLMQAPVGVLPQTTVVADAISVVRRLASRHPMTYLYAVDTAKRLTGIIVLKDLFLAHPTALLSDVMLRNPFYLTPDMSLIDAMKVVVSRHYPVYPVCSSDGKVIGLVRGDRLFEKQAIVISAQAGAMVGVKSGERLTTPWTRSLFSRHSWLQLNLLTTILTASVIAVFQETLGRLIVLTVFMPLITGQARNSGAQTMAITLRSMNLGEWPGNGARSVIGKEFVLALINGTVVGLVAFLAVWFYAQHIHDPNAWPLAWLTLFSMVGSCVFAGLAGVAIPMILRRAGLDPALAATILHSTAATIVAQLLVLLIAKWWLIQAIL